MTTILLIRHGQASFGSDDYDRLSPIGFEQAALVGKALHNEARLPDHAWAGTLRRQIETARTALAASDTTEAAADIERHRSDASFNEYSTNIVWAYQPFLAERDATFKDPEGAWRHDRKLFQQALSQALELWTDGVDCGALESWESFSGRVGAGLTNAVAGRGFDETIAIFTSGGVIATSVGRILGLAPMRSLALSWRIYNASISEIHYGRSGFTLIGFNNVSHLRHPREERLLTYR
jgi:broad specificity phosphatase PhoE